MVYIGLTIQQSSPTQLGRSSSQKNYPKQLFGPFFICSIVADELRPCLPHTFQESSDQKPKMTFHVNRGIFINLVAKKKKPMKLVSFPYSK